MTDPGAALGRTLLDLDADRQEWTGQIPPGREKKLLVHGSGTLWMVALGLRPADRLPKGAAR